MSLKNKPKIKELNSFFNNYLSNSSIIKTNYVSINTTNIIIENSKLSLLQEKEIKNGFLNHLIYNCQDIKNSQKYPKKNEKNFMDS